MNVSSRLTSAWLIIVALLHLALCIPVAEAQDTVTGAFEGTVTNSQTGLPVVAATAQIINQQTGIFLFLTDRAQHLWRSNRFH